MILTLQLMHAGSGAIAACRSCGNSNSRLRGHVAAVPQPLGCVREYQGLFWAPLRAITRKGILRCHCNRTPTTAF